MTKAWIKSSGPYPTESAHESMCPCGRQQSNTNIFPLCTQKSGSRRTPCRVCTCAWACVWGSQADLTSCPFARNTASRSCLRIPSTPRSSSACKGCPKEVSAASSSRVRVGSCHCAHDEFMCMTGCDPFRLGGKPYQLIAHFNSISFQYQSKEQFTEPPTYIQMYSIDALRYTTKDHIQSPLRETGMHTRTSALITTFCGTVIIPNRARMYPPVVGIPSRAPIQDAVHNHRIQNTLMANRERNPENNLIQLDFRQQVYQNLDLLRYSKVSLANLRHLIQGGYTSVRIRILASCFLSLCAEFLGLPIVWDYPCHRMKGKCFSQCFCVVQGGKQYSFPHRH